MDSTSKINKLRYFGADGASHSMFGACEIERRPRGASRAKLAPTFVSGQLRL